MNEVSKYRQVQKAESQAILSIVIAIAVIIGLAVLAFNGGF